ncbi:spore coat U domain-containing protein [Jeongeupia sp. USM3]|uniref:spore coat protein U domain-containing protein n=1 Tax=Jeongeupia sp. USM3 TaxID=1906741 RepID=UPI00089DE741|nr:spore coat U domain-containing protein [Jeongeupia sp. USM3]AOY02053.1 hypothetical protein BJP62_17360 [Jeongeupia sp. USM3]
MYRLLFALFLVMIARLASAGCSIGSGQDPSFGQYNPELSSTSVINFYVTITCDTATSYTLQAGPGTNSQSISSRYMVRVGGTEQLDYQLCTGINNVSCSTIFGDGTTGQPITGNAPGGGAVSLANATALLYGSQQVPVGDYADIVPVTLLP